MCDRPLQLFLVPPPNLSLNQSNQSKLFNDTTTSTDDVNTISKAQNDSGIGTKGNTSDPSQGKESERISIIETQSGKLTNCKPPCGFM